MITIDQVKELRDKTGVSIMQCKKALEEAGGDMDKAVIALAKKSGEIADKKGSRTLGAGRVSAYVHSNGTVGSLVELLCETDFVAKNEEFKSLAYDIAMHIAASYPQYLKREDISEDDMSKVKEVFMKEVKDKPADLQDKILQGKIDAHFKEKVLLEQDFIKNPEQKISDLIKAGIQKFGENIEIGSFHRVSIN